MAEPIYNRANLRKQVVDLLQAEKQAMTAGAISLKLHLPFWAVQSGLELALRENWWSLLLAQATGSCRLRRWIVYKKRL